MSMFHGIGRLFRSRKLDRDLEDELRSHLEMRAQDNLNAGMTAEEARLDAIRKFGNAALIQEHARATHISVWLESGLQDVRYGLRTLRKSPAFTFVAVLSLALGIGINTAVFSLIDMLLFREAGLVDPANLVALYRVSREGPRGWFPLPLIKELRDDNHVFTGVAAVTDSNFTASVPGEPPQMVHGGFYSYNYYTLLDVRPWRGRTFTPQDDQPSASPVAMIGYDYWQKHFAGSAAALEQIVTIKGISFQIVGIVPPGFAGLTTVAEQPSEIVLPWIWHAKIKLNDDDESADIVARLKPGTSLQEATTEANLIFHRTPPQSLLPDWAEDVKRGLLSESIELHPRGKGDEWRWRDYKLRLSLLMGVVALVLLIACANVANLLLARATARRQEIAIRLAIGAGRWRVIRQLLTENLLLAVFGGAFGLWLAWLAHRVLARLLNLQGEFTLDWRVLAFTSGLCLLAALLFGLAPAFRGTRLDPGSNLKGADRQSPGTAARSSFALGKALVVLQVTLSLLLVVGTGLLVRTMLNLTHVDPGFDQQNVILFWIYPTTAGYNGAQELRLYADYLRRFNAIPGVVKASMARHYLMQRAHNFVRVSAVAKDGTQAPESMAAFNAVAPGFFATMRIPLLAGQDFSASDTSTSSPVAIVDQKFSASHFAHQNPLGQHIVLPNGGSNVELEIVGVIRDVHFYSLRQADDVPSQEIFIPYTQAPAERLGQMCFAVRTAAKPETVWSAILREAQAVEPNLAVSSPVTQAEVTEESIGQENSLAVLTGWFSGLALLLACIGLYGVMAYAVTRRTREIGVRMALGAPRSRIRGMFLRESALLVAIGVTCGIPAAVAANRLLKSVLYGVGPSDISAFVIGIVALTVVAALAGYLPARRASRVDPMVALRNE